MQCNYTKEKCNIEIMCRLSKYFFSLEQESKQSNNDPLTNKFMLKSNHKKKKGNGNSKKCLFSVQLNKVFRLPKTLFIQGVRFYCTSSLLIGGIAPTNSEPVQ